MLRHWVGVGWTPRWKVLWRSQVEPWKTVWQCELEKKTRRVFRNTFPVIYRLSFYKHFKIPGNFEPIFGHESVVSLWRKRHFFKKPSKRWRGFPPGGMFMICANPSHGGFKKHCFTHISGTELHQAARPLLSLVERPPVPETSQRCQRHCLQRFSEPHGSVWLWDNTPQFLSICHMISWPYIITIWGVNCINPLSFRSKKHETPGPLDPSLPR